MACLSLALSVLGLACWLWIHKCMWIFGCTAFENESCDFEKIIQSVDGAWPISTGVNGSALKVNYVTNDVIARFQKKKSHTHSRLKRWQSEHQSTNYRLHFCVCLCGWRDGWQIVFFLSFRSNIPLVSIAEWQIGSGMGILIVVFSA